MQPGSNLKAKLLRDSRMDSVNDLRMSRNTSP
jgi:hypothetical protein